MKLTYIIENYTDSSDYRDLIDAVQKSGRDCYIIDKRNNFDFNVDYFRDKKLVLFQGSIQMTRHVRKSIPWCWPIAFYNESEYDCSYYYPLFAPFLFNDKSAATTVKHLKEFKWEYYAKFGKEALIFIRPSRGDKPFTGQLLDLQDFDRFWNNNIACNASDDDIVYVSTPKTILGEWRFVVSYEREIIAQSCYQFQGQKTLIPSAPIGATNLVNKLLNFGYHPEEIYCLDICQGADEQFYLLELTSFSSAGLYAADKDAIVSGVNRIVEEKWEQIMNSPQKTLDIKKTKP